MKIYLIYKGQRIAKKKTHVKKRTLNPVFNESFVFDIPNGTDELDSVSLEILLLDWDRVTRNEVCSQVTLKNCSKKSPKSLTSSVILIAYGFHNYFPNIWTPADPVEIGGKWMNKISVLGRYLGGFESSRNEGRVLRLQKCFYFLLVSSLYSCRVKIWSCFHA